MAPGKKIRVHANRGLAGIDGTIATALGIALASQAARTSANGVTRVLLGDLAMLHDVGALLFGVGEARPRIQLIVGNDGGGTIFDQSRGGADSAPTTRSTACCTRRSRPTSPASPRPTDGTTWPRNNRGELDQALSATAKPTLVEVPLPRAEAHS